MVEGNLSSDQLSTASRASSTVQTNNETSLNRDNTIKSRSSSANSSYTEECIAPYSLSPHKYYTRSVAKYYKSIHATFEENLLTDKSSAVTKKYESKYCLKCNKCLLMDFEHICPVRHPWSTFYKFIAYIVIAFAFCWYIKGHLDQSQITYEGFKKDLCSVKDQVLNAKNAEQNTDKKFQNLQRDKKLDEIAQLLKDIKNNQGVYSDTSKGFTVETGRLSSSLPHTSSSRPSKNEALYQLVQRAIEEYNADKTGKSDFALESAGGRIVGVKDTEQFDVGNVVTFFGIPLCPSTYGPRAIIQPSTAAGECWAFKGSKGSVVLQLLGHVRISCVSLEHISKTISPTGDIDSAPKDFSIWGLENEAGDGGILLGQFSYNDKGDTIQFFHITRHNDKPFDYIEFKVESNYGNPQYTCVYRLRVHGKLDSPSGR